MKAAAKVAVVMRTKDRPVFLRRAVRSIVEQGYKDWIVAIVNDRGEAASIEKELEIFPDDVRRKFILIENDKEIPKEGLLNLGIEATRSDYVVVLDDDDTWEHDFLTQTTNYLEDPENARHGGVVTGSRIIRETYKDGVLTELSRIPITSWMRDLRLWQMLGQNLFPVHAFVYRRSIGEKVGFYRALSVLGDWDFNIRFMVECDLGALSHRICANYHQRVATDTIAAANTELSEHHKFKLEMLAEELAAEKKGKHGLGFFLNAAASMATLENELANLEQFAIPANRVAKRLPGSKRKATTETSPRHTFFDAQLAMLLDGLDESTETLNAALRADIKSGKTGIGYLLNTAVAHRDLQVQIDEMRRLLQPVHQLATVPFRIKRTFKKD